MNRRSPAVTPWALAVSGAFLAVQLILVQYHEMWRDELQAWLIAGTVTALFSCFRICATRVTPALWQLLLMPLTRLFDRPEAMQFFHVLIATGSVFMVVRYSPFSTSQKLLLCLSYFLFYEYSQIARNYAPASSGLPFLCRLSAALRGMF